MCVRMDARGGVENGVVLVSVNNSNGSGKGLFVVLVDVRLMVTLSDVVKCGFLIHSGIS